MASVDISKKLKRLIERRHPDYRRMLPHWKFMEACYTGGRDWFVENIFRYLKEGEVEYGDRVKRAYRFNHSREVVDLVNKYLFRAAVDRSVADAPESVKKFWDKANLRGLSIDEFMRVASTKSSIYGRPWLIVDNANRNIPKGASQADTPEQSIYVYAVSPIDVLDLSWDREGNLNWILIREMKRDDDDPIESTGKIEERFRLWTRLDWTLIGKKGARMEVLDSGEHSLGEVPAVKVDHNVSDHPWYSPALLSDIAYLDRATANYASNLDAIIQDQTFSQLAMPAQNVLPGDDAYDQVVRMGTQRVFLYDGEGGQRPEYLSPDPRQAQLIISAIQQLINEIYHSVGLAGEHTKQDNAKGIDNSSGVAKAFDFERVTALLRAKADSLEMAENKVVRLVALWAGDPAPEKDLVSYSDNFDIRELGDELNIALQLATMELPSLIRSEQVKMLVEKLFPNLGEDVKKRLKLSIDEWAEHLKEISDSQSETGDAGAVILEEARRDREGAAAKQSETKSRETGI